MESNSAHATSSIHSPDTIDVAETHTSTKSYHTAEITVSEDITLEKALEDEKAKELVANTQVDNPFTDWKCAFGTDIEAEITPLIFNNRDEFVTSVEREIKPVEFLQLGLARYVEVLQSGDHHMFPSNFLESQQRSSSIAQDQLRQIEQHLLETLETVSLGEKQASEYKVDEDLCELFASAKHWIDHIRTVLVNGHAFYKINYALAADVKETTS